MPAGTDSRAEAHAQCVRAFLEKRVDSGTSNQQIGEILFAALRTIWARSRTSLGDITLSAIYGRVFETARRGEPLLPRLELRVSKALSFEVNADVARDANRADLLLATEVVLVELLRVIGRLTGETLTPALHRELSAMVVGDDLHPRETGRKGH